MYKQTIQAIIFLGILLTFLMLAGWIKDISHLCKCDFKAPYKAEFFYGAGAIFPPAGGFIGWLDIPEGKGEHYEQNDK